jgi:hypothetical protein
LPWMAALYYCSKRGLTIQAVRGLDKLEVQI